MFSRGLGFSLSAESNTARSLGKDEVWLSRKGTPHTLTQMAWLCQHAAVDIIPSRRRRHCLVLHIESHLNGRTAWSGTFSSASHQIGPTPTLVTMKVLVLVVANLVTLHNFCFQSGIILSQCQWVNKLHHSFLQPGGELYFSDVYADRELSEDVRKHEVLWGMYFQCTEFIVT